MCQRARLTAAVLDVGSWEASLVLNGHGAYSYSCLSEVPESGFIGLAWETVLPGTHNSYLRPRASANNILFTRIPRNFTTGNVTLLHTPNEMSKGTIRPPTSSILKSDDTSAPPLPPARPPPFTDLTPYYHPSPHWGMHTVRAIQLHLQSSFVVVARVPTLIAIVSCLAGITE